MESRTISLLQRGVLLIRRYSVFHDLVAKRAAACIFWSA